MWQMYEESLMISQKILNIFYSSIGENGVAHITQADVSRKTGLSYSNINKRIKKMNLEEPCIINDNNKGYIVKYSNLSQKGTYANVKVLLCDYQNNNSILYIKDKDLAIKYGFNIKTIQMFKSFARCGGN